MSVEVETKNASIETLSVTILAMHVSGKQMTLSVFRQLPEGDEDKDSELWGIVRYSIKDAGDEWLVFSSGGILRRRAMQRNVAARAIRDEAGAAKDLQDIRTRIANHNPDLSPWNTKDLEKQLADRTRWLERATKLADQQRESEAYENGLFNSLPQLFIAT